VLSEGPFPSDPRRIVQTDLEIQGHTDPAHDPTTPCTLGLGLWLGLGLKVYSIYDGYWYRGRPSNGGLRVPADFVKALALGADGIALANAPIQAIGCVGARLCNNDRCPSGVATQDPALRALIDVDHSAQRVACFFAAVVELMQVMARACGHDHLSQLGHDDIATWHREMADLTGIDYAGIGADRP